MMGAARAEKDTFLRGQLFQALVEQLTFLTDTWADDGGMAHEDTSIHLSTGIHLSATYNIK